jgi:hypothetical protein
LSQLRLNLALWFGGPNIDLGAPFACGATGLGETALTPKTHRLVRHAAPLAVLAMMSLAPSAARADFFDDMRRTFTSDIPHFFQDDVPCAFGGQPTSGTKSSCKGPARPTKPTADKSHAAAPPDSTNEADTPPQAPADN